MEVRRRVNVEFLRLGFFTKELWCCPFAFEIKLYIVIPISNNLEIQFPDNDPKHSRCPGKALLK